MFICSGCVHCYVVNVNFIHICEADMGGCTHYKKHREEMYGDGSITFGWPEAEEPVNHINRTKQC